MKEYKGYLIDLDGTMYRGNETIDGASAFVNALHQHDIPYLFLTNNSSKTRVDVSDKLNNMGIKSTPDDVVTTSLATAKYIKQKKSDARCFVIGEEGIHRALEEQGLIITEEDCDFVVVGIDRHVTYEKFAKACIAVRKGATFISTNSDVAIPTERGLLPGNGALTSVVAVSTGITPIFIGKPEAIIMDQALEILGMARNDTLMVGDNYNTDILAGIHAGIDTLMVFTGVTSYEQMEGVVEKPTYHVENLKDWIKNIRKSI
ncbi:4-nitrophenyl phosphatase [Virgibacillus natechei]|uniref:Acid sugar phosphatase n=1 Tax=Virgibacillus natechei TaxID=1216297 RepID=A0ABS4IF05_9BACI|nr:TIGR01457 family HAD-type hydrolase [Virgibacillus natechei]MBP1969524.1 4-nitrophenyl phosphatase [Virgibacillus natechei]UZD11774.1 TIGR01457 family HAD-type hydrolase [Virgibacillus natechei]